MSTLLVFGYANAPQGQPNAIPIQYAYLADGEIFNPDTDPYSGKVPLVADLSGNVNGISSVISRLDLPFKPSAGDLKTVVLRTRYWPLGLTGWARGPQLPNVCLPGQSIQVSAAEATALWLAGLIHL